MSLQSQVGWVERSETQREYLQHPPAVMVTMITTHQLTIQVLPSQRMHTVAQVALPHSQTTMHQRDKMCCILMAMWNGKVPLHVVIMIAQLVMTIYTVMPRVHQQTRISTTNISVCFMFLKRVISVKDITLFCFIENSTFSRQGSFEKSISIDS